MQLRDHPHVSYRGHHAWPPIWVRSLGTRRNGATPPAVPRGEVGTLVETRYYPEHPGRLFLIVEHEGAEYTGALLFDDSAFCEQLASRMSNYIGMSIEEIGRTDVP
jgi:hypothetical protein